MTAPPGLERYESLLQAALVSSSDARTAYDTWAGTFDIAGAIDPGDMALLPAVVANLQTLGLAPDDQDVWRRIRGVTRRVWTSNHLRLETLRTVLSAFGRLDATVLVAPGVFTLLTESNNVAAASLDVVELIVPATRAQRCVAALITLGATTDNDLASLLDDRFVWAGRLYAVLDGCPILLRWDVEESTLATSTENLIGSIPIRSLSRAQAAASLLQTITTTSESTATRLPAVLAFHVTVAGSSVNAQPAGKLAHEDASLVEFLETLLWFESIGSSGAAAAFAEQLSAYRPDPPVAASRPSRRPTRLLVNEVRAYRLETRRNNQEPTAHGLADFVARHVIRRTLRR